MILTDLKSVFRKKVPVRPRTVGPFYILNMSISLIKKLTAEIKYSKSITVSQMCDEYLFDDWFEWSGEVLKVIKEERLVRMKKVLIKLLLNK